MRCPPQIQVYRYEADVYTFDIARHLEARTAGSRQEPPWSREAAAATASIRRRVCLGSPGPCDITARTQSRRVTPGSEADPAHLK